MGTASERMKALRATESVVTTAAVAAIALTGAVVPSAAAVPGAHGLGHAGHSGHGLGLGHGPGLGVGHGQGLGLGHGQGLGHGPGHGQGHSHGRGAGRGHGAGHGHAAPTPPPGTPPVPAPHRVTPPTPIGHAPHPHQHGLHQHGHGRAGRCRACHTAVRPPAPVTPPRPLPLPVPVPTVPIAVPAPPAQGRSGTPQHGSPTATIPTPTSSQAPVTGATPLLALTVPLESLTATFPPSVTAGGGSGARATGPGAGSTLTSGATAGPAPVHSGGSPHGQPAPHPIATKPIRTAPDTIQRVERFVPAAVWWALAAAIALAALAGVAALISARRVRRQAGQFAAVTAAAMTDPLTGLLNRRGFIDAVERELARARRYGRPFVLAYVDVRGLKRVNDTEGHLAGDAVLAAAAHLLRDCARADDVVGRIGGDEFGVLLSEQGPEGAQAVVDRIRARVPARERAAAVAGNWDLTIGTAGYPQDGTTINDLLATADRRLYQQRGIALRWGSPAER